MDPHNPLLNKYPSNLNLIHQYQQLDSALLKATQEDIRFTTSSIFGTKLIQYQPQRSERKCIVVPVQRQYPAIRWLHNLLGRAGVTRLTSTLSSHFWFPHMSQMIIRVVKHCTHCQRFKINTQKYGKLPPKDISHINPWDEVQE